MSTPIDHTWTEPAAADSGGWTITELDVDGIEVQTMLYPTEAAAWSAYQMLIVPPDGAT